METTEKRELLIAFRKYIDADDIEDVWIDKFLSTLPDGGEKTDESSEDNCWLGDGTKNIEK